MWIFNFLMIIGVTNFPGILADQINVPALEMDIQPTNDSEVITYLSPSHCNMTLTFNISGNDANDGNDATNVTYQFVRSLVVSNLALTKDGYFLLEELSNPKTTVFNITGEGSANLPMLYLAIDKTYLATYKSNDDCLNDTRTLLQASFSKIVNDACTPINVTSKQAFRSYNYPNSYPLQEKSASTQCRNISSPVGKIYVTVKDLDLAQGHKLEFSNPKAFIVSKNQNDAIISGNVAINFLRAINSSVNINDKLSGRGFDIDLEPLDCGGELSAAANQQIFNGTETPQKCVWIIKTPKNPDPNIINVLNFTLSGGLDKLKIYDSGSRKNELYVNRTGAEFVNSTTETVIIEYISNNASVYLNWSTIVCPDRCLGVYRCINPPQRCNGINDCGDWSDELHCNGSAPIPQPKPEPVTRGVPGLVVTFVIIPFGIILGILGTILVPRLVARIRENRYSAFNDYSDVS